MLAHQSAVMLDAIVRTLIRMLVTRRHLLQWVTADRAVVPATLGGVFERMWVAPVLAVVAAQIVAMTAPRRLLLASPILALWFLSPLLAYITGLPLEHRHPPLNREQRAALRRTARRTWRFFEELLTPADNWLIPDNYQENRADVIAHRTSPTNIGLQLLAALGAYDFGYLSITGVIDRLEPTFETLLRMQRYRGHFYNWYDTRTLAPLPPAYISTVDSGNLAGYFLTLRLGPDRADRITAARRRVGARRARRRARPVRGRDRARRSANHAPISTARSTSCAPFCEQRPATLPDWRTILADIRERLTSLALLLHELDEPAASTGAGLAPHVSTWNEAGFWLERAEAAVAGRHAELERLTGWMTTVSGLLPSVMSLKVPSIAGVIRSCDLALEDLAAHRQSGRLRALIEEARGHAEDLVERADRLAALSDDLLEEIEFSFLFNEERQLFSIGYNVVDGRLDNSYYDILASEARLASYMAIALGKVSHEHWFKLGRSLTPSGSSRALLSWSASMFEYLMPLLVMRSHAGTLLDETYEAVVRRQIDVCRRPRRAMGHLRVGLQRPGRGGELSVQGFWRARPRPQTRPCRRRGSGPLRDVARGADRAARGGREPGAAAAPGPVGTPRLLRVDRLHAGTGAARREGRASSSSPTWRITRAWACSRSTTFSTAARCSVASTPTRASRPPSCCSRNGSRGLSR